MRIISKEELEEAITSQRLGPHQPANPFHGDVLRAMRNLAAALFDLGDRETVVNNIPESLRGVLIQE